MRHIERIEESFQRKLLKTTKGCPITSLYVHTGQTPVRFEIMKMRLLFLKYILEQPEQSNVKRMFELQLEMPSRGDWASTCKKDLNYLQIGLSLEEIRNISKRKYSTILKDKTREFALKYLLEKSGTKGKEIQFSNLEMAD